MTTVAAISDQSAIGNPWAVLALAALGFALYVAIVRHQNARQRRHVQAFLARNGYARTSARGRSSRFGA